MTDCEREDIRDLLPDLAAGVLSDAESARIDAHVQSCTACSAELALVRTARAIRPQGIAIDAAAIVAKLPRSTGAQRSDVVSLDARRALRDERVAAIGESRPAAPAAGRRTSAWSSRSVWRAAATIGVMIVGGWSILIVRSGGIGMVVNGRADSTRLSDAPVATAPVAVPTTAAAATVDSPAAGVAASERNVSVSFGGLADYSDEELQAVLDRLDKWDGATSTEANITPPILPVKGGGSIE